MSSFVQYCLSGDAFLDEIDDYIDQWHDGDSTFALHEFLGMSKGEYALWLQNPDILPLIIKAHKEEKNYTETFREEFYRLAARAEDIGKAEKLKQWLVGEGLWKD